jgi:hypothetical protein
MRFAFTASLLLISLAGVPENVGAQTFTWISSTGGDWSNNNNWNNGIQPQGPGNIVIRPAFGGFITGPTSNLTSTDLTVGSGLGTTVLRHDRTPLFALTGQAVIEQGARLEALSGSGMFVAHGGITNAGEVLVTNDSIINAGSFTNLGILRGRGQIGAPVVNSGRIELIDRSGEFIFYETVGNQPGGLIAVRKTNLRVIGGLTNHGALSIGDGTVDVFADINNTGSIGLGSGSSVSLVGDLVQNGTVNLLSGSKLTVFGDFSGTGGTTGPGLIEVLGKLSVGNSPARVAFGGDVSLGGGASTIIELGGVNDGNHDALNVIGSIALGGELDVVLLNDFAPRLGDVFEIIIAGAGVNGQFSTGSSPNLSPHLSLLPIYFAKSVALAVVPTITGDYNADGAVDAADFVVWRDTLNQSGPGLPADGNHDNVIDANDYDVWRKHFGQSIAGSFGVSTNSAEMAFAAPEPSVCVLLDIAIATLGYIRRPRERCRTRHIQRDVG